MPLCIHLPQIGVSKFVQRIVIELLIEGLDSIVVTALVPIDSAQVVVGVVVVGIDFDLFLKSCDREIVFAQVEIGEAKKIPGGFIFRIDFGGSLEQRDGNRDIAVFHGSAAAVDQFVGLHVGGWNRRPGGCALDGKLLRQVGADSAAEGFVIGGSRYGEFVLAKREFTAGGEDSAVDFVGGFVFCVIALQRNGQRRVRGVLGGQFELDVVVVFGLWTKLQRLGVVSFVLVDFGQIELHERKNDFRFLLGPIEKVH